MSDNETNLTISEEEHIRLRMSQTLLNAINPELVARIDRSAALAFQGKLNPPGFKMLSAEQKKWLTMDRFSKRELGDAKTPVKPAQSPTVTAQLAPGQTATITGPATIQGGDVKINAPGETKTE